MERRKLAGIVLAILNVILIVICVVFYFGEDRRKPELSFTATEIVYQEGIEESALLEGVSAYDSVDGDITDRIVIEKTVESRDDDTIVVFYAVTDQAGNVAKASRVFDAIYLREDSEFASASPITESSGNAKTDQDNSMNDNNTNGSSDKAQDALGGEEAQEDTETSREEQEDETADASGEEPIEENAERSREEQGEETAETSEEEPEEETAEATAEPTPATGSAAPILTLKVSEVSVNVGQGPAWVNLIETLRDDKDDYMTLFSNLNVSKYDRNKVGTYQVTVFVEDSDGNKSQSVPLTIIVK